MARNIFLKIRADKQKKNLLLFPPFSFSFSFSLFFFFLLVTRQGGQSAPPCPPPRRYATVLPPCYLEPGPPPPPPHSGVGGTACVLPKSLVKGYFSSDKVRPENCKKRGVFDFSPGDFFKKGGGFSFSLSLDA